MKPLKTNLTEVKKIAEHTRKKVKDMVNESGENIYKNIKDYENQINYDLYDLVEKQTGLKNLTLNMNIIQAGSVGSENKMTTGHSHKFQEEIYLFLKGKGKMILSYKKNIYKFHVKPNDIISVPAGFWHRVINTGKKKLIFINIFTGKEIPKSRYSFSRN